MSMALSDAERIFGSKSFEGWQKWRESEQKLQLAIINRLDALLKQGGRR